VVELEEEVEEDEGVFELSSTEIEDIEEEVSEEFDDGEEEEEVEESEV
jgi:hypothetical protein